MIVSPRVNVNASLVIVYTIFFDSSGNIDIIFSTWHSVWSTCLLLMQMRYKDLSLIFVHIYQPLCCPFLLSRSLSCPVHNTFNIRWKEPFLRVLLASPMHYGTISRYQKLCTTSSSLFCHEAHWITVEICRRFSKTYIRTRKESLSLQVSLYPLISLDTIVEQQIDKYWLMYMLGRNTSCKTKYG